MEPGVENLPPPEAPASSNLPKPRVRKWSGLIIAIWDSVLDGSLTPLNDHIKGEWQHMKHVLDLILFFMLVAGVIGWYVRGSRVSYLEGQLTERKVAYDELEKDRDKIQREDKDNTVHYTLELNETKRERDAKVSMLTAERDSVQQRLSYFEALPANVLGLYSNMSTLYANEPTNRYQLVNLRESVESIAKSLKDLQKSPKLSFVLNDIPLGKDSYITIPTTNDSQALVFTVYNDGDISADRISLFVGIPKMLQVVPSGKWQQATMAGNTGGHITYSDDKYYSIEADTLTAGPGGAIFVPITLQLSNLNQTVNTLILQASAINSPLFSNTVTIHFTNGTGPARQGF